MIRFILVCIALAFFWTNANAQEVQWASKVLGFSSEYKVSTLPGQYSATQILGKPTRFPFFSSTANAWAPIWFDEKKEEWIHVAYEKPMSIQQIVVAENDGAGSITRIEASDENGNAHTVYENLNPAPAPVNGRWFYVFCEPTAYKVISIKVVLNKTVTKIPTQIDAIAIASTKDSVKQEMRLIKGHDVKVEREDLGDGINATTDDLCPVISTDGKTLYFTRQGHGENIPPIENQDVWYSTMGDDGKFATAQNMGAPINNADNSSVLGITPDGQKLIVLNVYNADGTMEKGVSYAMREGDKWGFPKKMEIKDFYNDNNYGEYNMSVSGKVLIMTLQRKDGKGSKDMYVSFLEDAGTWTAPLHMGSVINSAESETSPFLAADEKTLYFSSSGFPGYGKNDVFVTHRLDDTWVNWSEPENLGPNLNSPGWDAYYTFTADGKYVYFVTNNPGKGIDIFRKEVPVGARSNAVVVVKGQVKDLKTKQPLASNITYQYLSNNQNAGYANSNSATGEYSIVLRAGETYSFLASTNDYYAIGENLDLSKITEFTEIKRDLYLAPIEKGLAIRLNNLFFDFNKSELKKESFAELERLIALLKKYPDMKIEISGHTDDVGTLEFNLPLSNKRALAVQNYLVQQGIDKTRLLAKGYGKTKPVATGKDEVSRRQNRRVEFVITTL